MATKNNLLYINFSRGWGGLEMFSANLFEWLSKKGHQITFAVRKETKLYHYLKDNSKYFDRVIVLNVINYIDIPNFIRIHRILKRKNISIIHTFKSTDIFFARLSTLFTGSKYSCVHHLQMLPKSSRKDLLHRFVYQRIDKLVTITKQIAGRVEELWPLSPDRITTIYYGIESDKYGKAGFDPNEIKNKYNIPEDKTVLGLVGQICPIKGQLLVVKAFHKILETHPDSVLVLAGVPSPGDEGYQEQIQNYIDKHNIRNQVIFTGFCNEVPALMSAFDLFVLGSTAEPFGLVVIEAMASETLVLASRAGGVPEIIKEGKDGFLYEADNLSDLTEKLTASLSLSEQRSREIVAEGLKTVETRFALSRFIGDIEKLYSTLQ